MTSGAGIQWSDGSGGNGGAGSAGKSVGGDDVNANGNYCCKGKDKARVSRLEQGGGRPFRQYRGLGDNNFLVLDAESARIPPPTSPPEISLAIPVTGRYEYEEHAVMMDVDCVAYLDIKGVGGGDTRSATALEAGEVASDGSGSEEEVVEDCVVNLLSFLSLCSNAVVGFFFLF